MTFDAVSRSVDEVLAALDDFRIGADAHFWKRRVPDLVPRGRDVDREQHDRDGDEAGDGSQSVENLFLHDLRDRFRSADRQRSRIVALRSSLNRPEKVRSLRSMEWAALATATAIAAPSRAAADRQRHGTCRTRSSAILPHAPRCA